jgi:hypothetical protein
MAATAAPQECLVASQVPSPNEFGSKKVSFRRWFQQLGVTLA